MDKVLVNIYVPIINTSYDMFIPLTLRMYEALDMVKKAVTEMSDGRFIANANNVICSRNDGTVLNINLSVFELGIKNGSRLMLI
ncbi:MAG: methyltransferase [Monoglobaceae bacterium]